MQFKFMHIADVHLGFQQYGLRERSDDFADAFRWVIDEAIREKVDFVLLAGDLFHKRAIRALTLNQAFGNLMRLKNAGIPCVAVEGNHELAYYNDPVGWMHFLALQELLILLHPDTVEGKMTLSPYAKRRGSWVDVLPGVRVHGMHFLGAATTNAIRQYATALETCDKDGIEYSILMAHAGVQGVIEQDHGSPTNNEWSVLKAHTDYVALGHIHKPFDFDNWLFNPGSLETNAIDEYALLERGYLLVNVDTNDNSTAVPHTFRRVKTPKRPFVRLVIKTDFHTTQQALAQHCAQSFHRSALDRSNQRTANPKLPIVEVMLTGNLPFAASALDMNEIQQLAAQEFNALHVLMKNFTDQFLPLLNPAEREGLSRQQLEKMVMRDLFAVDARFAAHKEQWAETAIQIKNLAVAKAPPAAILDELEASIQKIG